MNWQKRQQTKEFNHPQTKKINENLFSEFVDLYFELVRMEMEKYWTVLYSRNKKILLKILNRILMTFVDLMTMQLGGSRKMLVDAQMHMFLIANVHLDKVIHARNNLKDFDPFGLV